MSTNFPTSLDSYAALVDNTDDVLASHQNNRADAIEALEAKVGIDSSAVTTSLDYKVNNFFATGRKVYLYENVAPTGWSITAVTDKVLAVKGGTDLYNTTGGTTAGESWANLKAHSHTYTTVIAHTHTSSHMSFDGADGVSMVKGTGSQGWGLSTGAGHLTTSTGSASGTTGGQSTSDVRPTAAVGIICTKA